MFRVSFHWPPTLKPSSNLAKNMFFTESQLKVRNIQIWTLKLCCPFRWGPSWQAGWAGAWGQGTSGPSWFCPGNPCSSPCCVEELHPLNVLPQLKYITKSLPFQDFLNILKSIILEMKSPWHPASQYFCGLPMHDSPRVWVGCQYAGFNES